MELIADSIGILRRNPILAVPVLLAELFSFAATHMQRALQQPLLTWLLSSKESVLSGEKAPFVLTTHNAAEVTLIMFPLVWGCYLLSIFLYTLALLATAAILGQVELEHAASLRAALTSAWLHKKGAFLFSLSMWLAFAVEGALFWLISVSGTRMQWFAGNIGRNFAYFAAFVGYVLIAFLFTRPALHLLRRTRKLRGPDSSRTGVLLSLTVVTGLAVVLVLLDYAIPLNLVGQTTAAGSLLRDLVLSAGGTIPYVVLFIGLSRLTSSYSLRAEDSFIN